MIDDLMKPSEVLKKHPEITWDANQIGSLHWLGLVDGRKFARYRLVSESDVLRIYALKASD